MSTSAGPRPANSQRLGLSGVSIAILDDMKALCAARVCSLQQTTEAFFEVGGQYRRNV